MVSAHHASGNWPRIAHLVEHCTSTTELPISSPKNCEQYTLSFKSRLITINTYFNYVHTSVFNPILLHIMHLSMLGCYGGEARHRPEIWTQITFFVQIPGPREVILVQKSANSSPQGHYCWSKECKFPSPIFLPKMQRWERTAEIGTEIIPFIF